MRQFSAQLGPLRLDLEWRLTLFTLILFPFLMSLGFWQLSRADEKAVLAERYAERIALPPVTLPALLQGTAIDLAVKTAPETAALILIADRRVRLSGQFTTGQYLLLDNRIYKGRVGFEVIAILTTPEYRVPVNLGWIPGDPSRREIPSPALPEGDIEIVGRVYVPLGEAYVLEEDTDIAQLPAVIQTFTPADLRDLPVAGDAEFAPVEVRVAANDPMAFEAHWPIVNQSPEKHTGYAVQWFSMAAVLLLAFLLRSSNLGALILPKKR